MERARGVLALEMVQLMNLVFLISLLLLSVFPSVQAQTTGWINIDCGSTADAIDPVTGINWVTDAGYITTGDNVPVPAARTDFPGFLEFETLRRFNNSRAKNCYALTPLKPNNTYTIRATFFYDSYDGAPQPPSFQLAIDTDVTSNLTFTNPKVPTYVEVTMNAVNDTIYLCLVQDQSMSIPFVSAITVRPIDATQASEWYTYHDPSELSLGYKFHTRKRLNFGGDLSTILRYPNDPLDRYWVAVGPTSPIVGQTLNHVKNISNAADATNYQNQFSNDMPGLALSTALTPASTRPSNLTVSFPNETYIYNAGWLNLYFAELDTTAKTSGARHFGIEISDPQFNTSEVNLDDVSTNGLAAWYFPYFVYTLDFHIDLFPMTPTRLSPLLNALEMFEIVMQTTAATSNGEVLAIETIKLDLNLSDWTGDPCLPSPYEWLTCSIVDNTSNPRILKMNLSSYGLVGRIPLEISQLTNLTSLALDHNALTGSIPNISGLTSLEKLDLQNNNLSGPIPDWLASMTNLTELFLQNNNFNGTIPAALLNKTGPFNFMYSGNPSLIGPTNGTQTSSKKKKSNIGTIIGAVLGALVIIILLCVVGVYFLCRRRKKEVKNHQGAIGMGWISKRPNGEEKTQANQGNPTILAKSYSLAEVVTATKNFKTPIGDGSGLRPVYLGKLANGKEVAVKVFSKAPRQHGLSQFSTEVDVLSRVYHKHLVALVGYCQEHDKQIVIYEYMPKGSLRDLLYAKEEKLNWRTRLNIAFDTSQGLDYLHSGCHPSIIHRNIKNTTILLDNKMVAKLSNFGLSRETPLEGDPHVSTIVLGTTGYLDPEYALTQHLTTKSDVYSFGVVCLELLTGRAPFYSAQPNRFDGNICDWVRNNLQGGNMEIIVSPAIKASSPNRAALWKFAGIAMECVEPKGEHRPTMAHVVQEMRTVINMEEGPPSPIEHPRDSSDMDDLHPTYMMTTT